MTTSPLLTKTFQCDGIRIDYPEDWEVEFEPREKSVLLQSPGAAFWMLAWYDEPVNLEELVEGSANAYLEEYRECELVEPEANLGGHITAARDLDFLYVDLPISVSLRGLSIGNRSFVTLSQCPDPESDQCQPILAAIAASFSYLPTGDELEADLTPKAKAKAVPKPAKTKKARKPGTCDHDHDHDHG